jgi:hypothetical protein
MNDKKKKMVFPVPMMDAITSFIGETLNNDKNIGA